MSRSLPDPPAVLWYHNTTITNRIAPCAMHILCSHLPQCNNKLKEHDKETITSHKHTQCAEAVTQHTRKIQRFNIPHLTAQYLLPLSQVLLTSQPGTTHTSGKYYSHLIPVTSSSPEELTPITVKFTPSTVELSYKPRNAHLKKQYYQTPSPEILTSQPRTTHLIA